MTAVAIHAVVYTVVNTVIVLAWLMAGGSADVLGDPLTAARDEGFWPLWIIVLWGAVLALHAGITLPVTVAWRRRRRRKRARPREPEPAEGASWIAAMFTDIVGSTTLNAELGDAAWSDFIASHRRIVRDLATAHAGEVVGTQGDGALLRFDSPRDAVRCARALQERFAQDRAEGELSPPVRIGIHAGQAMGRDGDVIGQMVNVAARVADAAGPGEVLVTEPVADHTGDGIRFDDRGLQELKGVPEPRHVLALDAGD
jgi:class 3 adenylate cyclase